VRVTNSALRHGLAHVLAAGGGVYQSVLLLEGPSSPKPNPTPNPNPECSVSLPLLEGVILGAPLILTLIPPEMLIAEHMK